ncbi:hypothetical protein FB45DRAFT_1030981 [Roridomyces roridus]|uniref:Uncharacterized protein n=1 Tax=Roridomyces roridus TaxID=1738132 RepID=A0AAD7FHT7_9AGAR|nr:hypothetical protein FB45DRAFT_1030981 [Roridomyces roridus]
MFRAPVVQFALPDSVKEHKANLLPSSTEIQEKYRAAFGGLAWLVARQLRRSRFVASAAWPSIARKK